MKTLFIFALLVSSIKSFSGVLIEKNDLARYIPQGTILSFEKEISIPAYNGSKTILQKEVECIIYTDSAPRERIIYPGDKLEVQKTDGRDYYAQLMINQYGVSQIYCYKKDSTRLSFGELQKALEGTIAIEPSEPIRLIPNN